MVESTPVTRFLEEHGISYRLFQHPLPVHSLEQAARERGQAPEQVIRTILFRLENSVYLMVLIAGLQQVSWKTVRRYLGQSRMTMATEEEVLSVTGYPIGAVSPFGSPAPLRILVDENVFLPAEISIGSGVRGLAVIMSSAELKKALDILGAESGVFI